MGLNESLTWLFGHDNSMLSLKEVLSVWPSCYSLSAVLQASREIQFKVSKGGGLRSGDHETH